MATETKIDIIDAHEQDASQADSIDSDVGSRVLNAVEAESTNAVDTSLPMLWHVDSNQLLPIAVATSAEFAEQVEKKGVLIVLCDAEYERHAINAETAALVAKTVIEGYYSEGANEDAIQALRYAVGLGVEVGTKHATEWMARNRENEEDFDQDESLDDIQLNDLSVIAIASRGDRLSVAHIGNGALIVLRNGKLFPLIEESAASIELSERNFSVNDFAFACTRRLYELVGKERIESVLKQNALPHQVIETLIEAANARDRWALIGAAYLKRLASQQLAVVPREPTTITSKTEKDLSFVDAASRGEMKVIRAVPSLPQRNAPHGWLARVLNLPDAIIAILGVVLLVMTALITIVVLYGAARIPDSTTNATPQRNVPATSTAVIEGIFALPPTLTAEPTITTAPTQTPDAFGAAEKTLPIVPPTPTVTQTRPPTSTRPPATRTPVPSATATRIIIPTLPPEPTQPPAPQPQPQPPAPQPQPTSPPAPPPQPTALPPIPTNLP
jgi:hypothetical protein